MELVLEENILFILSNDGDMCNSYQRILSSAEVEYIWPKWVLHDNFVIFQSREEKIYAL